VDDPRRIYTNIFLIHLTSTTKIKIKYYLESFV